MVKTKLIPHYEFLREFSKQKPESIYYVVGTEAYLKDQIYKAVKKRFSDESSEDFDFTLLYGDSDDSMQVIEHLEMSPFLAKKRLVVIKNFDQMNAAGKNLIAEYCKNPSPTSVLLLIADKSDKRAKAIKVIEQKSVIISCRPPYSTKDLVRWLRSEVQVRNIAMDYDTMCIFADSIELDYLIASNELEKLVIYTRNKGSISRETVEEVIGKAKANKIFDLQDAIGK
ncbi:MAG TPA: DNA polymerase III subunit delta, partial [Desulfobacterales bacterium]|nr:DNA polymerase III subunit delta [Desulfobacterales bacterium]